MGKNRPPESIQPKPKTALRNFSRLKEQLVQRRDALQRVLNGELPSVQTGEIDRDAPPIDVDLSALDMARASAELQTIQTALEAIRTGVYGICTSCGVRIPKARLEARPSVQNCVKCQQRQESGKGGERLDDPWLHLGKEPRSEDEDAVALTGEEDLWDGLGIYRKKERSDNGKKRGEK